jgi:polar amino acid transport system substrate-binding protein
MVGFNRRFAPLIREAKDLLADRAEPLVMLYRVNAGRIPAESWIHGEEGGGRIVGEVCHFIDTLSFLADALPTETHIMAARNHPDALSMQLGFADGSIGTIVYSSLGDRSFPKEYIEVFGANRVVTIDDFRRATFTAGGKRRSRSLRRQDKGFAEEIRCFLAAVRGEQDRPISVAGLEAVMAAVPLPRGDVDGRGRT